MDDETKYEAGTMVGVDVGATGLRVGVMDSAGHIIEREKMATPRDANACAHAIAEAVRNVCARSEQPTPHIVGLGVPGPVSAGRITAAIHLGWTDTTLADMVRDELSVAATMINDVDAAALAEQRLGAAAGEANMIALWVGTSVGGGAVLGGRLYEGLEGVSVEAGHVILNADGPPGTRRVEQRCSRRTIVERVARELEAGRASAVRDATTAAIADAYRAGDDLCVDVVDEALGLLGSAAASVCAILGPRVVVVGGALLEAIGPSAASVVGRAANADAFPPGRELSVRLSTFGDDAGLIGAALFAAESAADTMAG